MRLCITPCNESKLPNQKAGISRLFGVVQNPWNLCPSHSDSCSENFIFRKFWFFPWFFFVRKFWLVSWVWETRGGGAPKSSILAIRSVYFSLRISTMFGVHASLWVPTSGILAFGKQDAALHTSVTRIAFVRKDKAVIRMRGRQTSWKCAVKRTRSEPIISMI